MATFSDTLSRYTKRIFASGGCYDLELLVKPWSDLDGTFKAWDVDAREYLSVNGWLFTIEEA